MSDMLADLAYRADLFHTADGTAFIDLTIDGHRETWPVRSLRIKSWLRRMHYEVTGEAPRAAAVGAALDLLEARAQFDLPRRSVFLRTAEHDGRLYLDLADECWRVVEITPEGWRVIDRAPVRFRRTAGMLPLAIPTRGGSLGMLSRFINVSGRDDFILIAAWLLTALRHGGRIPFWLSQGNRGRRKLYCRRSFAR